MLAIVRFTCSIKLNDDSEIFVFECLRPWQCVKNLNLHLK